MELDATSFGQPKQNSQSQQQFNHKNNNKQPKSKKNHNNNHRNATTDNDEIIKQLRDSIEIKNLSDRKKELKQKKHSKPKMKVNSQKNDEGGEGKILQISEEEMQHYQQLKIYGASGPPPQQEKIVQLSEEIKFKLDVLQSSKMFFENIQPRFITIYSGYKEYDDQVKIYYRNYWFRDKDTVVTLPRYLVDTLPLAKHSEYLTQLLNRTDFMSCMSSDMRYLYIYGGKSKSLIRDDLLQYEIQTGKLNVYNNLSLASRTLENAITNIAIVLSIPSMVGGEMFESEGCIYVIGRGEKSKGLHLYTIENLKNPMEIAFGLFCGHQGYYEVPGSYLGDYRNCFTINHQKETNFVSFQHVESKLQIYLFGGKVEGKAKDEMIIIHIPIETRFLKNVTKTTLTKPKVGDWPRARFSHSSCMIGNSIFIYGGLNSNNEILNDLYMFDTTNQIWTEVSVESMLPPPLYRHHSFTFNNNTQSFFIYGGQTHQEVSNSLFRFDIVDRKWSLIEVISDERNEKLTGNKCVAIANNLYIIGGTTGEKENSTLSRPFKALLNVNDPGKPIPICNYLSTKRKEGYLCDIAFRCKDMESSSTSYILAHRCIVKTRCSFLSGKLSKCTEFMNTSSFEGTFLNDQIGVVDISKCHSNILEKYLEYLYTGSLYLENSEMVHKFLEFVKSISKNRHYPFIEKICSIDNRKNLSLTKEILKEMYKDFSTLIDDSTYSDLVVVLDQDNPFVQPTPSIESIESNEEEFNEILSPLTPTKPSGGISVHRLIMSRSPFFSRMFVQSKMLESTEKVVHLTDYSKDVMIEMLKYLYTDIIQLSASNCLGIMVYSLMFDLTDLASCARRMVISLLDSSTVWVVHEIAVLYNEKSLESECEVYIANNFSVLGSNSSFLDLPEMSRIRIKQLFEKKNQKKTK